MSHHKNDRGSTGSGPAAKAGAVRRRGPARLVLAVPVAPPETLTAFAKEADETICLSTPEFFQAVGQYYEDFSQTSDEDVRQLLGQAEQELHRTDL